MSKQFDGQGYKTREELRHIMWADNCEDIPGQICEGRWNEPQNHSYDGVWYGIWQGCNYTIAREQADTKNTALEKHIIPSGTYAAFKTECGWLAWEEFPKLRELIFDSWLPSSEYRQKENIVIEVLHLWTDHDIRNKNRYYEVWIPTVFGCSGSAPFLTFPLYCFLKALTAVNLHICVQTYENIQSCLTHLWISRNSLSVH